MTIAGRLKPPDTTIERIRRRVATLEMPRCFQESFQASLRDARGHPPDSRGLKAARLLAIIATRLTGGSNADRNHIQREHHKRISYQDEFRAFLRRYEIEFDERYVWD